MGFLGRKDKDPAASEERPPETRNRLDDTARIVKARQGQQTDAHGRVVGSGDPREILKGLAAEGVILDPDRQRRYWPGAGARGDGRPESAEAEALAYASDPPSRRPGERDSGVDFF